MKKIALIILFFLTCNIMWGRYSNYTSNSVKSNKDGTHFPEAIYTVTGGGKYNLHGMPPIQSDPGNFKNITPYAPISEVNFSINNTAYQARLLKYKGWVNTTPGDYNVFRLYSNDEKLLEFIEYSSWVKIDENQKSFSSFPNDYFHIFQMDNGITIIILVGYTYNSCPPNLTFIAVQDNRAEVIFNPKEKYIIKDIIKQEGGYFELELQDAPLTSDPNFHPNIHTLKAMSNGMFLYQ